MIRDVGLVDVPLVDLNSVGLTMNSVGLQHA